MGKLFRNVTNCLLRILLCEYSPQRNVLCVLNVWKKLLVECDEVWGIHSGSGMRLFVKQHVFKWLFYKVTIKRQGEGDRVSGDQTVLSETGAKQMPVITYFVKTSQEIFYNVFMFGSYFITTNLIHPLWLG